MLRQNLIALHKAKINQQIISLYLKKRLKLHNLNSQCLCPVYIKNLDYTFEKLLKD